MIIGYEEFEGPIGICTPGTIEAETGLLKNNYGLLNWEAYSKRHGI